MAKPISITLWLLETSRLPTLAYCKSCPHYHKHSCVKCLNENTMPAEDWIIGEYRRLKRKGRKVEIETKLSGTKKFFRLIDYEFQYPYKGNFSFWRT